MKVLLAIAWADHQDIHELDLPEGATVADALAAAHLERRYPTLDVAACRVGIWSRPCAADARLREGDRVELYRPLIADPKQVRRARAREAPRRRR
ncbi:hypothetical protein BWI17_20070 [Betaproteobacteria bacterium GR16-43]|nr:hypothetical protein BWI17_20070 [Betaproteobacteria bacterium GR16-43]